MHGRLRRNPQLDEIERQSRVDFCQFGSGNRDRFRHRPSYQIICKNHCFVSVFAYDLGMDGLFEFVNDRVAHGHAYFSRAEALSALGLKPAALTAAITRLIKKKFLATPRHGFFLILRPEDRIGGAPDPVRWIDPLMRYQGLDYRISLLRAAAFHGSSHQAAMVFQVIAPRQLRNFEIGRHRLQFIYQTPKDFDLVNRPDHLVNMKTDAGFAQTADVALTLLDCARYLHQAAGIGGLAQVVKDIGAKPHSSDQARRSTRHYRTG